MSDYSKKNASNASTKNWMEEKQKAENDAFDRFAEMLIKKIETVNKDWHQAWFAEGYRSAPRALYGKYYHGMNNFMLSMLCEEKGWKIPVFATFYRISLMNWEFKDDKRFSAKDKDGNKLPFVRVLKDEHSFPVFVTTMSIVHNKTKKKIKYPEYACLSPEEQEKYNIYYNRLVHFVFNVDQTNIKETRPELYAKLEAEYMSQRPELTGEDFSFAPVDEMIEKQLWVCPVRTVDMKSGESPHYSVSKDEIVLPEKAQFSVLDKPEFFYGNFFHEAAHSTGSANRLNRLKPSDDRDAYAREELVAEVTAASVCQRYGMVKYVKEDSAPYLKSWLGSLKKDPTFIRSVFGDVKKAASYITTRVEQVREQQLRRGDQAVLPDADILSMIEESDDELSDIKILQEADRKDEKEQSGTVAAKQESECCQSGLRV